MTIRNISELNSSSSVNNKIKVHDKKIRDPKSHLNSLVRDEGHEGSFLHQL